METRETVVWTVPLLLGLVAWWTVSFAAGMLAMLVASALVWLVLEH